MSATRLPPWDFANWDQLEFDQLSQAARPYLRSIVEARFRPQLLSRLDPSDVVQEVLLEAHRRFADFRLRRPMPIHFWLRQTALQQLSIAKRHHHTTLKRSLQRQISLDRSSIQQFVEQLTATYRHPAQELERAETAHSVHEALLQLGNIDREILLLRYVNGLSNAETALLLGVSETVASKRHCRALLRLQKLLEIAPGGQRRCDDRDKPQHLL